MDIKRRLLGLIVLVMVVMTSVAWSQDVVTPSEVQLSNEASNEVVEGNTENNPLVVDNDVKEQKTTVVEPIKTSTSSTIKNIVVTGNDRTEDATILSYLDMHKGGVFNQQKSETSLRSLYATGLFATVDIAYRAGTVTITVKENPIISKIIFEGNDALKTEILQGEISLKPRMVFSKEMVQSDTTRIVEIYGKTGRYSATVKPQIVELSQNRVNLVFEITEGKKSKIKKIIFIGNKSFSSNKLREVLMSKEEKFYNFFARTDYYDSDLVNNDKLLLTRFYNSEGYANFKVISATADLLQANNSFYLTFSIEEGNKYDFGNIDIESKIPQVDVEELKKAIKTKTGNLYNILEIENTTEAMLKILANQGYPFVIIDPVYTYNEEAKTIDIKYVIGEARKTYIGKINISGNLKTHDNVIRREFRIAEGDPYNEFLLNRSEQRLNNLDFFEKVSVKPRRTDKDDIVDVDVDVAEKSTASLKFSVGYSTTDGVFGLIGLTERNFVGKGQEVSASIQKSSSSYGLTVGFMEPYFMEQNLSAGVELFATASQGRKKNWGATGHKLAYNSYSRGGSLNFGYEMIDYLYHNFGYTLEHDNITDVDDDAPFYLKQQSGKAYASILNQGFTYDRTDNQIIPKRGYILKLSQNLAGLGGSSKYIRNVATATYYQPVVKDKVTLKVSATAGMINELGKPLRVTDNFNLGDSTFRGFEFGGIGPRDKESKDGLGGTKYYKGTTELSFPIGLPEEFDVTGSIFSDVGTLWNVDLPKNQTQYSKNNYYDSKALRASVGVGILWVTRMAPLRIDIARAVKKEHYDETQLIHFSFQTAF